MGLIACLWIVAGWFTIGAFSTILSLGKTPPARKMTGPRCAFIVALQFFVILTTYAAIRSLA